MSYTIPIPEKGFAVILSEQGSWHIQDGYEEPDVPDVPGVKHSPEHSFLDLQNSSHTALVVFLTERCNMRCSYCKYGSMIRSPDKSPTDAIAIASAIEKVATIKKNVRVTFFGGEPMLEYQKMGQICESLENFSHISFAVTTNGTVLNEKALDILSAFSVVVGVSFDGSPSQHNKNRILTNHRTTHEVVSSNYKKLKQRNIECGPISVIADLEMYRETFDYFRKEFHDRTIYLKPIELTGTEDLNDISEYFESLLSEQMKLLDFMIDHFHEKKEKLVETYIDKYLWNIVLSGTEQEKACTKNPHCGIGDELQSIKATGEIIPCHDLTKFDSYNHAFIENLKTRNNYCVGCEFSPVCPSFCLAQFDKKYIEEFASRNNTSYVDILCHYNKEFIREIFIRLHSNKKRFLGYLLG